MLVLVAEACLWGVNIGYLNRVDRSRRRTSCSNTKTDFPLIQCSLAPCLLVVFEDPIYNTNTTRHDMCNAIRQVKSNSGLSSRNDVFTSQT